MRRKLLVLGLAGSLLIGVAPGIALADENPGGCKEFGQFVASAAHAPGPYGQTVRVFAPGGGVSRANALAKMILCEPAPPTPAPGP